MKTDRIKRLLPLAVLIAAAALLTVFSEQSSAAAAGAMGLCATRVIPALFPYMVISSLLVSTGAARTIGRIIPAARIFGLPDSASAAVMLGAVCGFPVGAQAACELYSDGSLSRSEAEALIAVCNNTGPSFVVSVIGVSFWNSSVFGWYLYAFQLAASLISSIAVNRVLFPFRRNTNDINVIFQRDRLSVLFSKAVSSSAVASLNVCGFVVFFAVVISFVKLLLGGTPLLCNTIAALLEFTEGARLSSETGGTVGAFLCGFTVGWSGISVFCQAGAFALPLGLSLKRCVVTKLLQGLLCGVFSAVFVFCYPLAPARTAAVVLVPETVIPTVLLVLFSIKTALSGHKKI